MIDVLQSVDTPHLWDQVGPLAFPAWVPSENQGTTEITIADPPRIRNMRLHLVSVFKFLREAIDSARRERDFDFEWFPNLDRPNVFRYSISKENFTICEEGILEIERLLRGDTLIPFNMLPDRLPNFEKIKTKSLSIQKLLDEVSPDLFMMSALEDRWHREGVAEQYFEETLKKRLLRWDRIQNGFVFLWNMFKAN